MAAITVTPVKMEFNTLASAPAATAVTSGTDGGYIVCAGHRDDRLLIALVNAAASAKAVTFQAGDGFQGVADMEVSVPASSTAYIVLESAKFCIMSGEHKGKIHFTAADTNISVSAIELP